MVLINRFNTIFFTFLQILTIAIVNFIIGPLIPIISSDLKIGLDIIGLVISIGAFASLIITLVSGYLIELFGIKVMYILGSIFCILGLLGLYFSHNLLIFSLSYISVNIATSIIFVFAFSFVSYEFTTSKTKNLLKIITGDSIGRIIGPLLVSLLLVLTFKWQNLFIYLVIPQVVVLFYFTLSKVKYEKEEGIKFKKIFKENRKVITNKNFILCSIIIFFYSAVINTFFTWFTSYFSVFNINVKASTLFLAGFSFAGLIGLLIKNFILRYISEIKVLFYSIVSSFIFLLLIYLLNSILLKNIFIFLFGICVTGTFVFAYSMGIKINQSYAYSVSGLLIAAGHLGKIIFQYLTGYFSEHFSKISVLYVDLILLFMLFIITLNLLLYRKHLCLTKNMNIK